ncbi:MAG: beta/gamma crystallin-related protein [Candidatus Binatia bacterium]|jgi:Beta/Gamma crystallin
MAKIWVHDQPGQGGHGVHFTNSVPDLREVHGRGLGGTANWNDEIQSFFVESGVWQLFEHIGYLGLGTQHFGPGTKGNCPEFGFPNNWISSIKKISD